MLTDTISAVCTASGEGAIGIIRISGTESINIVKKIFKTKVGLFVDNFERNKLVYGYIYDGNEIIDEVFCVCMYAPYSYTREDVVEIHCHGSIIVLQKILLLTYKFGARPADAGEFTKRAFLNGRIDLTQAESVMAIIRSTSEVGLKQALYQQQGLLAKKIKDMRANLKDFIVQIEAVIDYPEEDLEDVTLENATDVLNTNLQQIDDLLSNYKIGKIIKEGLRTVIVGKPNVGKSSLLNSLTGSDSAIVTSIAGTTRDCIEEQVHFDGLTLVLIDTAGIRHTNDEVEKIGIQKSKDKLEQADVVLLILDGSEKLSAEDEQLLFLVKDRPHLVLINKNDLHQKIDNSYLLNNVGLQKEDIINVSVLNKDGWKVFIEKLKQKALGENSSIGEGVYVQEARHKNLLDLARGNLSDALDAVQSKMPLDCVMIDVKNAFYNLGLITGEAVDDEILKEIFARFCLGK